DSGDVPGLGLAHGTVLLAPAEDALDHGPARLGDAVTDVTGGALVEGAGAAPTGFALNIILRHVRRDVHLAERGHVIAAVIGFVLAARNGPASGALVEACVSFLRLWPWKSEPSSSLPPSFGLNLLRDAHALSVPSTEKWSSDNTGFTVGWSSSLAMNFR